MQYGITPGRASRGYVAGERPPPRAGRDKPVKTVSSRFAPELVQAANALGIHPAQLEKALKFERKARRLADKFNH